MSRKSPSANAESPADAPANTPASAPAGDDSVARFETSLKELESIVARMERGDLPLEESLVLFERGMSLTRECRGSLDQAELRVRRLLDTDAPPGA